MQAFLCGFTDVETREGLRANRDEHKQKARTAK